MFITNGIVAISDKERERLRSWTSKMQYSPTSDGRGVWYKNTCHNFCFVEEKEEKRLYRYRNKT